MASELLSKWERPFLPRNPPVKKHMVVKLPTLQLPRGPTGARAIWTKRMEQMLQSRGFSAEESRAMAHAKWRSIPAERLSPWTKALKKRDNRRLRLELELFARLPSLSDASVTKDLLWTAPEDTRKAVWNRLRAALDRHRCRRDDELLRFRRRFGVALTNKSLERVLQAPRWYEQLGPTPIKKGSRAASAGKAKSWGEFAASKRLPKGLREIPKDEEDASADEDEGAGDDNEDEDEDEDENENENENEDQNENENGNENRDEHQDETKHKKKKARQKWESGMSKRSKRSGSYLLLSTYVVEKLS
eukprot:scaffold5198_cov247-Pinguiococcus_pyrenoidosus.AAC.14